MNVTYIPNKAEYEWNTYILQACFGHNAASFLPSASNNGDINNVMIRVDGGFAVQFLCRSGLPIHVLKVIWDVADPEGYGSLSHM